MITSHIFFKSYQRPNVAEFVAIIQKPRSKTPYAPKRSKSVAIVQRI
jgi:hypothetical protein